MVPEKVPYAKEYLLSAIRESLYYFDEGFCFNFVKSVPERIKTIIEARIKATSN